MADESFGDSIDDVECLITRHQEFVEGQMPVSLWVFVVAVQWNHSTKDTPSTGHLSNEDTVCSPNHIELCTNLPLN